MGWIHELPPLVVGLAIGTFFVSSSLAGLWVTRGWTRRRGLHALVDNGVIGWMFSATLGIYAIAIGLIAVASWSNTSSATTAASREAAQIAGLYRDLGGYPEPIRGELEALMLRYTETVIADEWPMQRRGEVPHEGMRVLSDFERLLYSFEPTTEGLRIEHAEAFRAFNGLVELRRRRLEAVNYSVPTSLWSVVLIGAVIAIGSSYVFNMESWSVHAVMTGLLAAMISLLVYFIAITDRPFHGQSGVSAESYELLLDDLRGLQQSQ
jgi:hypothetical protein